ncbi:hypothetical protein BDW22DRAFT_1425230 [Trametopsis cervina]|nr:hypothetical protein BDW22DRAFT_1425230 [Trametopsis cervina]
MSGPSRRTPRSSMHPGDAKRSTSLSWYEQNRASSSDIEEILATSGPGRRNLPLEARHILDEYCRTVTINPDPTQRKRLLERVVSIRGAEWYTSRHIRDLCSSRRVAEARKLLRLQQPSTGPDTLQFKRMRPHGEIGTPVAKICWASLSEVWPSLTAKAVKKLYVLNKDEPQPDQSVIAVWSRALKVKKKDIANWLYVFGVNRTSSKPSQARSDTIGSLAQRKCTPDKEAPVIIDLISPVRSSISSNSKYGMTLRSHRGDGEDRLPSHPGPSSSSQEELDGDRMLSEDNNLELLASNDPGVHLGPSIQATSLPPQQQVPNLSLPDQPALGFGFTRTTGTYENWEDVARRI